MLLRWAAAIVVLCLGGAPAWSACQPPGSSGFPAGSTRLDAQTKDSVSLTGGCIDGIPIGQNAPAAGTFTDLTVGGALTINGTLSGVMSQSASNATLPDARTNLGASVTGGIWPGSLGGTGVANTGKTLTLGGNVTSTGTGPTTLAFPSSTATYTFPTTSATLMDNAALNASLPGARTNLGASVSGGIWPGSLGGTGVDNTGKTLTLGGNVTSTGTGPTTFALPSAAATYTYPPASTRMTGWTPAVCDGFYAGNAATTASSTTFTSASGTFTPADVGKKITINGAGPTFYFSNGEVVTGGAGHTIHEEISLTGGTGTPAKIAVRVITGGAMVEMAGVAGTLGVYTVVPANPVTAGDATVTVTWERDNLVTTIAAYISPTQVTLATAASATVTGKMWGYGTDYGPEINAALVAQKAITLPPGLCGIGETVYVGDSQSLAGQGTGGYNSATTQVLWLGAAGGTALAFDSDGLAASAGTLINGTRVGPFNIFGLGGMGTGVHIKGVSHSTINLQVRTARDYAFRLAESDTGLNDVFFNEFKLVAVVLDTPSKNAIGIAMQPAVISSGLHGPNGNTFLNTAVFHWDGIGIDGVGYVNIFYLTQMFSGSQRTVGGETKSWGIYFRGSNVNGWMRDHGNVFHSLLTQAPMYAAAGTYPSIGNIVDPLDTQAFAPVHVIESGATLYCVSNGTNTNKGDRARELCTMPANNALAVALPATVTDTAAYRMITQSTFVPRYSGVMALRFSGSMNNPTNGASALVAGYYGTGTPPANGELLTDAGNYFACGSAQAVRNPAVLTMTVPFGFGCTLPYFARGTTWWYALVGRAVTSGTLVTENVHIHAAEIP